MICKKILDRSCDKIRSMDVIKDEGTVVVFDVKKIRMNCKFYINCKIRIGELLHRMFLRWRTNGKLLRCENAGRRLLSSI